MIDTSYPLFLSATTWLLLATSFLTAIVSVTMGLGGGVILLAVMANIFPPLALIPLHGLIQMGNNTSRAALLRQDIKWRLCGLFALGSAIGCALGAKVFVALPEDTLRLLLAGVILFLTWLPKPKVQLHLRGKYGWVGLLGGFMSMFIGASGPVLGAFIQREGFKKQEVVGTHAACMVTQHGFKVILFGTVLGFAFQNYIGLLVGMLVAGFAGTWVGRHMLHRVSDKHFKILFKAILTVLAFRLIYIAVI